MLRLRWGRAGGPASPRALTLALSRRAGEGDFVEGWYGWSWSIPDSGQ